MNDSPDDIKRKQIKEQLLKSDPKLNYLLGVPEHEAARKSLAAMGISDAPIAQLQGIGQLFAPKDATYQGPASPASQKMGLDSLRPAAPDIMRANGPIGSLTPAQIAGNMAEAETMNRAGAGIARNGFGGIKKLFTNDSDPMMAEAMRRDAMGIKPEVPLSRDLSVPPTMTTEQQAAVAKPSNLSLVQPQYKYSEDLGPSNFRSTENAAANLRTPAEIQKETQQQMQSLPDSGEKTYNLPDDDETFNKIKALFNNNN